jgi:hypothetical protein
MADFSIGSVETLGSNTTDKIGKQFNNIRWVKQISDLAYVNILWRKNPLLGNESLKHILKETNAQ